MYIRSTGTLACFSLILGITAGCHPASGDPTASSTSVTKIDPELAAVADGLTHGMPVTARTDTNGRLQVYVYVSDTSSATLAQVAAAGLADSQPSPGMDVIQGWVSPKDLAAMAELTCVRRITLPRYAAPR